MAMFNVWAPGAESVAVELPPERQIPMDRSANGWWRAEVDEAGPGTDYRFFVDGGGAFPDPRSPWQPEGVHGPSRLVDHAAFRWTDDAWRQAPLAAALFYELHVGTFTSGGTFDSAVEQLPYLAQLGVTHVELMPVVEFSGERGWGYDGVDLFAPHHAYGGPEGLKRFVDACHARDLAVVLDVVYNHFGCDGNYSGKFGPYQTDRHPSPWGPSMNFDGPDSDEVRRFFVDNARMWFRDYHVDGLRVDAVHAMVDHSAKHILEELAEETAALGGHLGRPLTLIAESDLNDPRIVRPREAGGYGFDAQWCDDFRHSLHTVLTGENMGFHGDFGTVDNLATALRQGYVYCGQFSRYRGRCHGRPPEGLQGDRLLGYMQNHDQVGNRAQGERSSHLMSTGKLKIAAAVVLMSPLTPMLFQGEEWAASTPFLYFTDHKNPTLAQLVSEGRRKDFEPFGWDFNEVPDPQDAETFERSKLDWEELERAQHAEMLEWHRRLLELRRTRPELTDPRMDRVHVAFDADRRWLVFRRGGVTVACNFGDAEQTVPVDGVERLDVALASEEAVRVENERVVLPPESVAVLAAG